MKYNEKWKPINGYAYYEAMRFKHEVLEEGIYAERQ